jgi:hypothetical protein
VEGERVNLIEEEIMVGADTLEPIRERVAGPGTTRVPDCMLVRSKKKMVSIRL